MPVDKWRTVARRIDKYHGRTYMVGGFIGVLLAFFAVFSWVRGRRNCMSIAGVIFL